MQSHETTPHPFLIFIRGVPGSGKSYLARALQESIGQKDTVVLDPDTIEYDGEAYQTLSRSLSEEGLDSKIHPFRFLRGQAYEGIAAHKVIIWNQPFTNRDMFNHLIERLQGYASEHAIQLPVLLVEVDVDFEIAKKRVIQRKEAGGHGPSERTLEERMHAYQSFADGYRAVSVSGDGDVSASVGSVLKAMEVS